MRKRGFTLMELMVVMGLIVALSSVVLASYFNLTRGAAAKSAASHLRAVLTEARQMAIMRGKRSYIIFQQDTGANPDSGSYVFTRHEGTTTEGSTGVVFGDKYGDLTDLGAGGVVWNLTVNPVQSTVVTGTSTGGVQCADGIWSVGHKYGWELSPTNYLPKGFIFGDGASARQPQPVIFAEDGTLLNLNGTPKINGMEIQLYEKINPDYLIQVNVEFVGMVNIEYGI